jgi:hypothetical protein
MRSRSGTGAGKASGSGRARLAWAAAAAALLAFPSAALAQGEVRVGIDLSGEHEMSGDGWSVDADTKTGFSVALEFALSQSGNTDLGFGVEYQAPREIEDTNPKEEINFIPIYLYARIHTGRRGSSAYLSLRGGYNIFEADDDYKHDQKIKGGLCYGLGLGIPLSYSSSLEVTYSVNTGTRDVVFLGETDIEYTRTSIVLSFALR